MFLDYRRGARAMILGQRRKQMHVTHDRNKNATQPGVEG
jgi:hypothetical protein